jgi:DNA polymerase V
MPEPTQPSLNSTELAWVDGTVSAGFAGIADDYLEQRLDVNEYLVRHPAATFLLRVRGDSMVGAPIPDGSLIVVDKALEPTNGNIVVAVLNGEFTLKRLRIEGAQVSLVPENSAYPIRPITEADVFKVWGVVRACLVRFVA